VGLAVVVEQVEVAGPEAAEAVAPPVGFWEFRWRRRWHRDRHGWVRLEEVDPEAVAGSGRFWRGRGAELARLVTGGCGFGDGGGAGTGV